MFVSFNRSSLVRWRPKWSNPLLNFLLACKIIPVNKSDSQPSDVTASPCHKRAIKKISHKLHGCGYKVTWVSRRMSARAPSVKRRTLSNLKSFSWWAEVWVRGRGFVSVFTANLHIRRAGEGDAALMKLWDGDVGVCVNITANLLYCPDIITALQGVEVKMKSGDGVVSEFERENAFGGRFISAEGL